MDGSAWGEAIGTCSKHGKDLKILDGNIIAYLNPSFNIIFFSSFQPDMCRSQVSTKPTVNEQDLDKLKKFTEDFGQEG